MCRHVCSVVYLSTGEHKDQVDKQCSVKWWQQVVWTRYFFKHLLMPRFLSESHKSCLSNDTLMNLISSGQVV